LPRTVLATLAMAVVLWAALRLVEQSLGPVFGTAIAPAANFMVRALTLAVLIGVGGATFGLGALLFGAAQLSDLKSLRRKRN
jgi:hypothetical protein